MKMKIERGVGRNKGRRRVSCKSKEVEKQSMDG